MDGQDLARFFKSECQDTREECVQAIKGKRAGRGQCWGELGRMARTAQDRPGSPGLKGTHVVGTHVVGRQADESARVMVEVWDLSMHGVTRNWGSIYLFHFEFPFSVLATRYMLPIMLMAANRSL